MKRKIDELFNDFEIVNFRFNGFVFDSKFVELYYSYMLVRKVIFVQLSLYSKDEIEKVKNLKKEECKKIIVEEVEVKCIIERGFLYWFLFMVIFNSRSKDKMFLFIGLEIFGMEEKIIRSYI